MTRTSARKSFPRPACARPWTASSPLTDLFLPSGPELFLFTQATSEPSAAQELLARGIKAVVVKNGAEGSSYHGPDTALTCPAFAVEEIDPTGAGDTFAGTFRKL